jgi:threonine aldolase
MYDFRSDTVTKPCPAMSAAMAAAQVGDDVFGDDPTVIELETRVAAMCGKEAAMFAASGTMTNQIALKLHLGPLQSVVCDARSHIVQYENGGVHYHSGAAVVPIVTSAPHVTAAEVEAHVVRGHALFHKPVTTTISLENTLNGIPMPLQETLRIADVARRHNLRLHLDGARVWNAAVATATPLSELVAPFDTASLCFSKGLGAPIGSCLVGSKADIQRVQAA